MKGVTYYYSAFTYDTTSNLFQHSAHSVNIVSLSILSLSPDRGSVGTSVVIKGTGFGVTQRTNKVTFNGVVAQISSWSASSITAIVP